MSPTENIQLPTLRYAVIRGDEFVEVERLVELLRLNGEESAAQLIAESSEGQEVRRWKVKP